MAEEQKSLLEKVISQAGNYTFFVALIVAVANMYFTSKANTEKVQEIKEQVVEIERNDGARIQSLQTDVEVIKTRLNQIEGKLNQL